MSNARLTKAEEKEMFVHMAASCTEGYVKEILTGIIPDVLSAIDSDYTFVELRAILRQQREATVEREALQQKVRELKEDISAREYRLGALKFLVSQAKDEVNKLAQNLLSASR